TLRVSLPIYVSYRSPRTYSIPGLGRQARREDRVAIHSSTPPATADLLDRRRRARRVVARVGVDRLDGGDGRRVGDRALLGRPDDDRHACGSAVAKIPQRTADGRPLCATAPLAGRRGPEPNVAVQRIGEAHTARSFEAIVPHRHGVGEQGAGHYWVGVIGDRDGEVGAVSGAERPRDRERRVDVHVVALPAAADLDEHPAGV